MLLSMHMDRLFQMVCTDRGTDYLQRSGWAKILMSCIPPSLATRAHKCAAATAATLTLTLTSHTLEVLYVW